MNAPPVIHAVLETALYGSDLDALETFYREVLGLKVYARQPGRHVFFKLDQQMLLLFQPAATRSPEHTHAGPELPLHGATGAGHVAFRVAADELPAWRQRLTARGIAIEMEIDWPAGGKSMYFRDPAGNSLELATPQLWALADDASR